MMLERLACKNGRNDEELNILLAQYICEKADLSCVLEIVEGVMGKEKAVANDCIKVLYEIGERKPELIQEYVPEFISLLKSPNNRLVWGAMTSLACVAPLKAKEIFDNIEVVKKAYMDGSVITVDQSISVFAQLCKSGTEYEKILFPFLMNHLRKCRPKEVAQHAERISVCVNESNKQEFLKVLEDRMPHLNESQRKRVNKLFRCDFHR